MHKISLLLITALHILFFSPMSWAARLCAKGKNGAPVFMVSTYKGPFLRESLCDSQMGCCVTAKLCPNVPMELPNGKWNPASLSHEVMNTVTYKDRGKCLSATVENEFSSSWSPLNLYDPETKENVKNDLCVPRSCPPTTATASASHSSSSSRPAASVSSAAAASSTSAAVFSTASKAASSSSASAQSRFSK